MNTIDAFLYIKQETGPITDVQPALEEGSWLKIGTMKVNPHGTRLGERLIKKLLDYAIVNGLGKVYVTIFPKHTHLVKLFMKYGFIESAKKETITGIEMVLTKSLQRTVGETLLDYPLVVTKAKNKHLLAIKPEFHTKLFPDSILRNEKFDIIENVSHTNSIHKVYITGMKVGSVKPGDLILIYRTKTENTKAWYTSVATSICVVEEVKNRREFSNIDQFMHYCKDYSVFTDEELVEYYQKPGNVFIIKMTYNIALRRRLNLQRLWAELSDYKDVPIQTSITLLEALHSRFITLLHSLSPDDFNRTLITQVLGVITIDIALQRFVWHNQHHISQIGSLI